MKKMVSMMMSILAAASVLAGGMTVSADMYKGGANLPENTLDITVDRVTEEEAPAYTALADEFCKGKVIEAGDYKVTVRIFNNTGFANTGFRLHFDIEHFEPRTYWDFSGAEPNELPIGETYRGVGLAPMFSLNRNEGRSDKDYGTVGWATMGFANSKKQGELYSFFFTPREGCGDIPATQLIKRAEILQWTDADRRNVSVSCFDQGIFVRTEKLCGDLNEDGVVDTRDAQYMLELSATLLSNEKKLRDYGWHETITSAVGISRGTTYQTSVLAGAADVTGDGNTNIMDAQAILNYYVHSTVVEEAYEGPIGEPCFAYEFVAA